MPAPTDVQIQLLGAELVVKAYENHKTHARFQESQRSWVMGAFIAFSSGLLTVVASENLIPLGARTTALMLGVHMAFCLLTGIAITKFSRERGRHFRRAEELLSEFRSQLGKSHVNLARLLDVAQLETSSYSTRGFRQITIKFLSVAAVYNYFVSLFLSIDVGLILDGLKVPLAMATTVSFGVFVAACFAQHLLSRWFMGPRVQTASRAPAA